MENKIINGQVIQFCPFCKKEHEVEKCIYTNTVTIKGDLIEYTEDGFTCLITQSDDGNSWVNGKMLSQNLLSAFDSYRLKHGLLTSTDIKNIRKKYNLNQKELSNLLGWGDITVSRYETKHIQDDTYDSLLRMVATNPSYALNALIKHKALFTNERFEEIKSAIKSVIKREGNIALKQQEILNKYVDFDFECDANGYKLLDIDKISDVIAYFARHTNNLYKVKLMKLLWYADILFFNNYNKSMTGLVYVHKPLGALPLAHNEIIYLPTVNVIEEDFEESTAFRIVPLDKPVDPLFTLEEQEVLSKVALKFKNMTGKATSDYMHNEDAYKKTYNNDVIPYSMASNLIQF